MQHDTKELFELAFSISVNFWLISSSGHYIFFLLIELLKNEQQKYPTNLLYLYFGQRTEKPQLIWITSKFHNNAFAYKAEQHFS